MASVQIVPTYVAITGIRVLLIAVLRTLSVDVLAELVDDMERRVRLHSESLVSELARRDELDFGKEQRNQFIWLLLRVQKRRHQLSAQQRGQQRQTAATGDAPSCQSNAGVSYYYYYYYY